VTRVLVTGGGGFVGLPLLTQLAGAGMDVHATSTRAAPPAVVVAGVRWHRLDLFDAAAVDALLHELAPEQLVHLAWCTKTGHFWRAPENVTWVQQSLHLLRAFARRGGRRLVMLGTCAEYDWSHASEPLHESSSRSAPATLYGVAKDSLRRVAAAYAEQQGIELAWGRLFFLYGPREEPGRLVSSVIRALLRGQPAATSSGRQLRDFMYVEDVASAIATLLDSPVTGAVNIASGVQVTVGEVLEQIARTIGRPELIERGALPDRDGEPPRLLADVTRLRDEVGFRARWPLADGIPATVRWWQEHLQAPVPGVVGAGR
jgi:nucleoside-diphosphate-sugar epimerase